MKTASEITLAVCSNNPLLVMEHFVSNLSQLGPQDKSLVVFDTQEDVARISTCTAELRSKGVCVVALGSRCGLSHARNVALASLSTRYLIFVDDDIRITRTGVEAVRNAFDTGSHVVGLRMAPAFAGVPKRWYITEAQFHYLGLHRPGFSGTIWGGCMSLDTSFVRAKKLAFRLDLGRQGGKFLSGEDTTFISQMRAQGGRDCFLDHIQVTHHISPSRLTLSRIVSRAFWQGRTETLRGSRWEGAVKEWRRNIAGWHFAPVQIIGLALFYEVCVFAGVAVGSWATWSTVFRKLFTSTYRNVVAACSQLLDTFH